MPDERSELSVQEASLQVHVILQRVLELDRPKVLQTIVFWNPDAVRGLVLPKPNTPHAFAQAEPDSVLAGAPVNGLSVVTSPNGGLMTAYNLGPKAKNWMRRYNVPDEALERVFNMEGQFEVIALVNGATKRESAVNCYLLCGIRNLLGNDEARFSDAEAVALCKEQDFYDMANHAHTRSTFGNRITGTKESGYMLPAPGLEASANLVKTLGA